MGKYQCTDKKRAPVKFNVCGVGIPTNATILNAQMNLWYYAAEAGTPCGGSQVPTNGWVQAHRMLVPWHEAQATRDVRLTGVNWTTPYAAINGTDALATMESTVQNETGTWKSWTLTNAVCPLKSSFWRDFVYFPSKTAKTMSRAKHPVATVLVSLCSPARLYPEFLPSQSY